MSTSTLFRLQKYKKFESNSQLLPAVWPHDTRCFDCKSTKNLRAIHNFMATINKTSSVVSTAKVQKIWEQFTTSECFVIFCTRLFRLQKYKKFESNSQQSLSTLRWLCVVSTAKVQKIWEQFTTPASEATDTIRCFDCKSTKNLRAIHNTLKGAPLKGLVVSTAKVQKIWEQFTTSPITTKLNKRCFDCKSTKNLRAIHNSAKNALAALRLFRLQKYKKFESNSQQFYV